MEIWIAVAVALVFLVVLVGAVWFFSRKKTVAGPATQVEAKKVVPAPVPVPDGITEKVARTRTGLLQKLGGFFSSKSLNEAEWLTLEEALLQGDVGVPTTQLLIENLKTRLKEAGNDRDLKSLMVEEGQRLLGSVEHGTKSLALNAKPFVVSIVGVNGVGKTTTIGKLAQRYTEEGKTVLLGAGDTFRAAAISQLKVWADRTGAQFVTGREGGDPGAVAFDSITAAKARGIDVVFLDTAGRLHTKTNLMEELKKIHRVMKKVIPEAPHETWLVIDGTLGQNSVHQAREFQKALDLTGVIVTKLDGTAKGGALLAIASELKLPIRFIGLGETAADLVPFEPKPFVEAILGA